MRAAIAVALLLLGGASLAYVEDGAEDCSDGFDNDGDGLIDCQELTCKSSLEVCGLLSGPIAVGIGSEAPYVVLDAPMMTATGTLPVDALVKLDLDGADAPGNDLVVSRASSIALFRNLRTPGYASLPQVPEVRAGFMGDGSKMAGGDFSGDGRGDLVVVDLSSIRRYVGTGGGEFVEREPALASPGTIGGLPAVNGPTIAVANSRLRLYDERCTAPSKGFPNDETFAPGGLCASVPIEGTGSTLHIEAATVDDRSFFLVVRGSEVTLYEVSLIQRLPLFRRPGRTAVTPLRRSTISIPGIVDVAYSPADRLFVFGRTEGRIVARQISLTTRGAELQTVDSLPEIPVAPRALPDEIGRIAVGEFVAGERSVVITEEKTERLYILPFSTTGGWRRGDLVVSSFDTDPSTEQRASDVVVGHFNDDDLADIAVLDAGSGNLIVLLQQPPPCLTFITSGSHGLLPEPSYTPLSRFNRKLAIEVVAKNAERRPGNRFRDIQSADNVGLCPARFIDVRGHWEMLSGTGQYMIVIGRAAWITSSYLIWTPGIFVPLIFPTPAMTPIEYWMSAVWLLSPIPDPPSHVRFLLGGIGGGAEIIGRTQTSAASVDASRLLNAALRSAIDDAHQRMDACTGVIYLDLLGHSRGGSVVTHALRHGLGSRSNYNFEVSTTLLDAVDPSGSDNLRPWIRAGYIVGDPVIARIGSEWNSSFYGNDSSGEVNWWIEDLVGIMPATEFAAEFIRADVIGFPKGRNRQSELEIASRSFGAYAGPLANIRHKEFAGDPAEGATSGIGMMWVHPNQAIEEHNLYAPHPAVGGAANFSFSSTSHLGKFLTDPRGFDPSEAVGFRSTPFIGPEDEESCFPVEDGCNVGTGRCDQVIGAASAQQALQVDHENQLVREFVPDFDFRILTGLVRNANDILILFPSLKDILPNPELETLRTFIAKTASSDWVTDGTWRRKGDAALDSQEKQLALEKSVFPYLADSSVDYGSLSTPQSMRVEVDRWSREVKRLSDSELTDRVATLAAAAARMTSEDDASVTMSAAGGSISATLAPASVAHEKLLVRVEYELTSNAGQMSVDLAGPNLTASSNWNASVGNSRRVAEQTVVRSAPAGGGRDVITVSARDTRVFAVSVRPATAVRSVGRGGTSYEFVLLETGVTPERARSLASRSVWEGRKGRLAQLISSEQLSELKSVFSPDARGWVDGFSHTGESNTFKTSAGHGLDDTLFTSSTIFSDGTRPRGAAVFASPASEGVLLGHAHPGTSSDGQRVGFWVEYEPW